MIRKVSSFELIYRDGVDNVADQIALETGVAHVRGGRVDVSFDELHEIYRFDPYVLASSWTGRG